MRSASVTPSPGTPSESGGGVSGELPPEIPKAPLGTPVQTHHSGSNIDNEAVGKLVKSYSRAAAINEEGAARGDSSSKVREPLNELRRRAVAAAAVFLRL